MANPRFNKQTTNRRGAMGGGRVKKMGGGMTRKMYSKGSGNGNGKKGGLGAQSVKYGLDKNYDVTAADPKAKFIAKNKKGKKNGKAMS